MFILKKGHQPGVYVPLRALFLVCICKKQVFSQQDLSFFHSCRPEVEETNLISSSMSEPPPFTQKQTALTTKGKNQNYSLSNWVPKPLGQGVCVVGVNQ